ncbi:hypothetical protein [Actinomadura terrae]|uniref:hypothetical protein n=1 Tax=Actinomadura terrae TaxID=604353 RepID=UPI001FA79223|nr:hypothetical protein [Actinomadura terrae]
MDDGSGSVLSINADLCLFPVSDTVAGLVITGRDTGLRFPVEQAVPVLIAAARTFLRERHARSSDAWRLSGLPGGAAAIVRRLGEEFGLTAPASPAPLAPPSRPAALIGPLREHTGGYSLGVVVPLGTLAPAQAELLDDLGGGTATITPWRTVVLENLDDAAVARARRLLGQAGLPTDPASEWLHVTACAGRPGCGKALSDVRADAARLTQASEGAKSGVLPVHWAACERRCGRPAGSTVEVLATGDGRYELSGGNLTSPRAHDLTELPAAIAQARRITD